MDREMNKKILIGIGCLLLAMAMALHSSQVDFPKLTGPYLGQKPPGKTPEPFASNIPELYFLHGMIRFSPDGNEAYWKPAEGTAPIFVSKIENGQWTKPKTASFSVGSHLDDSPFFSPDSKRLFFISSRPPIVGEQTRKERIWVMERTSEGWSEPKPLPDIINSTEGIHWQFSVDSQGNLYFGAGRGGGNKGDIYCAKYKDGRYNQPEKMGPEINVAGVYNYGPYIYPDGQTLLFSREHKGANIFVSFMRKDGIWTEARILNSDWKSSTLSAVTLDGKYLFFAGTCGDSHTCWVEASFIEELRKKELLNKSSEEKPK
jgi:hypothetical protein